MAMLRTAARTRMRIGRAARSTLNPRVFSSSTTNQHTWYDSVALFGATDDSISPSILPGCERVKKQLERANDETNSAMVPWFLANMPPSYFYQTHVNAQMRHLRALSALHAAGARKPNLTIFSEEEDEIFMIRPGVGEGMATDSEIGPLIAELPEGKTLQRVKKFTALDQSVSIVNFKFAAPPPFDFECPEGKEAVERMLQYAHEVRDGVYTGVELHAAWCPEFEDAEIMRYLQCCSQPYVERNHSPRRFFQQMLMARRLWQTEGTRVSIEPWDRRYANAEDQQDEDVAVGYARRWFVDVSSSNVLPHLYLQKVTRYLNSQGLTTRRVHFDTVRDPVAEVPDSHTQGGGISQLRLLVAETNAAAGDEMDWERISADIRRLKWLDERVFQIDDMLNVGFARAEALSALGSLLHGPLHQSNPYLYSRERIFHLMLAEACAPHATKVAELFLQRFDPADPASEAKCVARAADIREGIKQDNAVTRDDHIEVLEGLLEATLAVQKTNFYMEGRYALSMVLDPAFMGVNPDIGHDTPFGTFFVHGRRFNAFHVRFRDIARGGLRVVNPRNIEMHGNESARQYREAYSLAFAQQLKNKDIPEGGSKGVLLIEPKSSTQAAGNFVVRKSVKAFTEAMIDLTHYGVDSRRPDTATHISTHLRQHEDHIYFGPDENIIPEDIEWITTRAEMRNHPMARALISSKPDAGINHKVYGVTSEGVNVYLNEALLATGIDPMKDTFTVKITGGTDGDVAGNMIKCMQRDYNGNARVVAICDATATAECVEGLDMEELMRLVTENLPVCEYKSHGELSVIATGGHDAVAKRDSMSFRVQSDVFVPAGGRPATITLNNCEQFLLPDGSPSSALVVEGANLFIDPAARAHLFEKAGVMFVRDSSANKCGVISSSYEIMACMLLDKEEFLGIKEELVQDVLVKLRGLARTEAQLLFREQAKHPDVALPVISTRTSEQITRVHDAVVAKLGAMTAEERASFKPEFDELVHQHLPSALARFADRVPAKVPAAYVDAVIAASVASRLVYEEGLDCAASIPCSSVADTALSFLREKKLIRAMAEDVRQSGLQDAERIASLLERGGVRVALNL